MKNRMLFKLLALLLTLGLVAAACGSDDNETAAVDDGDDTTSEPATGDEMDDMDDAGEDEMAMMPFGPACEAVPTEGEGSFDGMADDPAATAASANPVLSTLVTAVMEADLVDTLNSEGPFTIFAPTNDAFDALPDGALDAVLADVDLLTSILTYHVVLGEELSSDDLAAVDSVMTVQEDMLAIDGLTIGDGANVVCADVHTANATVHIIDSVLLPQVALDALSGSTDDMEEPMDDMAMAPTGPACAAVPTEGEGSFDGMADDPAATAASANPVLSTLVTAVMEADLVDTLNSEGPFTIFAPTNDAFDALPDGALDAALADVDLLTTILTNHVVIGESFSSSDLAELGMVETAAEGVLTFTVDGDTLVINDGVATVGCADVPTANATVHIIDGVLLPS